MKIHEILEKFHKEFPELVVAMKTTEHGYLGLTENVPNPFHLEGSVWSHTMMVLKVAETYDYDDIIKLACLCHDLGKPFTVQDIHEKRRRSFFNHEAVSTFYTRQVLEIFELSRFEKEMIIKIVSLHGHLYPFFEDGRLPEKVHQKIADRFDSETFERMGQLYNCDHEGRFYNMGTDMHGNGDAVKSDFNKIKNIILEREKDFHKTRLIPDHTITVLIGPPRVGKSSLVSELCKKNVIISRDALVEEYGTGSNYSEKWSSLTDDQQKDIDTELTSRYQIALAAKEDIVIDMTNMNAKSRRKWLNDSKCKHYFKKAIVLIESKKTLTERNTEDKFIPEVVTDGMMRRYSAPTYEEFDHIKYVLPDL